MISVLEAQEKVLQYTTLSPSKIVDISDALACVLSVDVFAPIDYPPFWQSSMDGYAVQFDDGATLQVIGEVQAGNAPTFVVEKGRAARIFTGAPLPKGANCVVMQEQVNRVGGIVTIAPSAKRFYGAYTRAKGAQIKKGALALKKGTYLSAAAIGFLASLGINTVAVYAAPKVAIVVTGDELVDVGEPLQFGQIYESNGITLSSALAAMHLSEDINFYRLEDNAKATEELFSTLLNRFNVLLISGGISVGDYDFVGKSLLNLGVETIFYKVAQKPGKPLFFGQTADTLIFALPGNPASALVCFYEYVYPALRKMMGHTSCFLPKLQLEVSHDIPKKMARACFYRAKISDDGKTVRSLEGQESFMMQSFAVADALLYVPAENTFTAKGSLVEVHKM
jgi:molybdopterin molybdotransferase